MTNAELRSYRMKAARAISTHTPSEWQAMLKFHAERCCRCFSSLHVQKDHIVPIYQGGSDGIDNLQPLCRKCNCAKGPCNADYRRDNWKSFISNSGEVNFNG